ncbi:MAG: hypothetical protein HYS17_10940 [Micavibrio aeruginosavorus]|uniref:Uncharacterized protein n=1 Tax=Micavibrio aeruginosavorus TaxID=349221 RepID=A0A7T5R1X8_9BACT|nr:MAG: hypothetical protein HYS17_10940 [Micavibrio aeruginosavorus]
MNPTPTSSRTAFALAVIENGTHNPHIQALLEAVEERTTDVLPLQTVCAMIKIISSAVVNQAQMDRVLVKDSRTQEIISLPLDAFEREIKALTRLGTHMKFSIPLIDWLEQRLDTLARRMGQQTRHGDMQKLWDRLDTGGRIGYLRSVNTMQMSCFSDPNMTFAPSDIICRELPDRIHGLFGFNGYVLAADSTPQISINPRHLQTATCADMTGIMVHEGLHSILRQLGRLHHFGLIPDDHPFIEDAALMATRLQTGAYLPAYLGKAYYADAEERLCFRHTRFDKLYCAQSRNRAVPPLIGHRPEVY